MERDGNSKDLSHKAKILLKHLNMTKDQILGGIEDGLSDFDSCLNALKVFFSELNIDRYILIFLLIVFLGLPIL